MKKICVPIFILLAVLGCKRSSDPAEEIQTKESAKIELLQQKFHGKYRIISALSDTPVDVNMDGSASTDLLTEIPILDYRQNYQFNLELRIYANSPLSPNPTYLLSQSWPEQYIWLGDKEWDGGKPLSYDPAYSVSLVNQGTGRLFNFSDDLKQIIVHPGENENPNRWVIPKSIVIDERQRLHVVNVRNFYTSEGVKQATVTTVYERFTKDT